MTNLCLLSDRLTVSICAASVMVVSFEMTCLYEADRMPSESTLPLSPPSSAQSAQVKLSSQQLSQSVAHARLKLKSQVTHTQSPVSQSVTPGDTQQPTPLARGDRHGGRARTPRSRRTALAIPALARE